MPEHGYAVHDTRARSATAGEREKNDANQGVVYARNELYCMGGNRTKGVLRHVFSSRLLISYLQCVGGQSPLLFLIYITHRVLKVAVRFSRCQRSTMLSHNRI